VGPLTYGYRMRRIGARPIDDRIDALASEHRRRRTGEAGNELIYPVG